LRNTVLLIGKETIQQNQENLYETRKNRFKKLNLNACSLYLKKKGVEGEKLSWLKRNKNSWHVKKEWERKSNR
jgi:hypothetical protein